MVCKKCVNCGTTPAENKHASPFETIEYLRRAEAANPFYLLNPSPSLLASPLLVPFQFIPLITHIQLILNSLGPVYIPFTI